MRVFEVRRVAFAAAMAAVSLACGEDVEPTVGRWARTPPDAPHDSEHGSVKVTTVTSGADIDSTGYSVRVDGYWDYSYPTSAISTNGMVILRFLTPGRHVLSLDEVAGNCRGDELQEREITVKADSTIAAKFQLVCE